MNPRTLVCDPAGRLATPFARHLGALTSNPIRGAMQVAAPRTRLPAEEFARFWQGAFGSTLRDEPITSGGLATRYLLDELRKVENA